MDPLCYAGQTCCALADCVILRQEPDFVRKLRKLQERAEKRLAEGPLIPRPPVAYERVRETDPEWPRLEMMRAAGMQHCDARDHNEPAGCPNPDCFKYASDKRTRPETHGRHHQ